MRNRMFQVSRTILWLTAAFIVFSSAGCGQEVSAGVTGTVTDPSGAAIVGATVTATSVEQRTVWTTAANAEGIYAFPRVPAGQYEIRFEAAGFRTALRRDIVLELNARARLDVKLEIGMVAEAIEVSGTGALLQTETTQVGTVISGAANLNLPIWSCCIWLRWSSQQFSSAAVRLCLLQLQAYLHLTFSLSHLI